jgi:hypothetical protein
MKGITVIFLHTILHQCTMRSVVCNKMQCQEGSSFNVRGNIIRPCRNKIMKDWPPYWQLKLDLFSFKSFVSANGLHVFCFDQMYSKVIKATLRLKGLAFHKLSLHLKHICNGVPKLWNATVTFIMSILYSSAYLKWKTHRKVPGNSKISIANSCFINVWQQIAKIEY